MVVCVSRGKRGVLGAEGKHGRAGHDRGRGEGCPVPIVCKHSKPKEPGADDQSLSLLFHGLLPRLDTGIFVCCVRSGSCCMRRTLLQAYPARFTAFSKSLHPALSQRQHHHHSRPSPAAAPRPSSSSALVHNLGRVMASSTAQNGSSTSSKVVTKDKIYDEHWQQPRPAQQSTLKVWNSLTRSKVRGAGACLWRRVVHHCRTSCQVASETTDTDTLHCNLLVVFHPTLSSFTQVDFVPSKGKHVTW